MATKSVLRQGVFLILDVLEFWLIFLRDMYTPQK